MDSQEESEPLQVYFPEEILKHSNNDLSKCLFVGWESRKGQIYVINCFSETKVDANKLKSLVDSINRTCFLRNVTYVKNGLRILKEFTFSTVLSRFNDKKLYLSDSVTGNEIKNVVFLTYKNSSFDLDSTDLLENLKVQCDSVEESLNVNSDIGSCCVLATSLKKYMDGVLSIGSYVDIHDINLGLVNKFNRMYRLSSTMLYFLRFLFVKVTLFLSMFCYHLLNTFKFGGPFFKFIEKYSSFMSLLLWRLRVLANWHQMYNDLMNQTEIEEYLKLENELTDVALSFYIDLLIGILNYLFFRKFFIENLFFIRTFLKSFYIDNMKSLFYFMTTKIFLYIKLNNEVSTSLSKFVINKVLVSSYLSFKLNHFRVFLFKVLEYSSILGISFMFAFLADLLSYETLHLFYLYLIMLGIMGYFQKYLYSLIQLFKGKKWNVLKFFLDTNEFTKDQLFIGVVFFLVFSLNYPTIWVFYVSIITLLIPILGVRCLLLSVVELLSRFPCYYVFHNGFFASKFRQDVYFEHKFECTQDINKDGTLEFPNMEVKPTRMTNSNRTEEMISRIRDRLNQVSPTNILRKVLKCKNIFNK